MDNAIDSSVVALERFSERGEVQNIAVNEGNTVRDLGKTFGETVVDIVDDDVVTLSGE
jgi:hypothetical protein